MADQIKSDTEPIGDLKDVQAALSHSAQKREGFRSTRKPSMASVPGREGKFVGRGGNLGKSIAVFTSGGDAQGNLIINVNESSNTLLPETSTRDQSSTIIILQLHDPQLVKNVGLLQLAISDICHGN